MSKTISKKQLVEKLQKSNKSIQWLAWELKNLSRTYRAGVIWDDKKVLINSKNNTEHSIFDSIENMTDSLFDLLKVNKFENTIDVFDNEVEIKLIDAKTSKFKIY